LITFSYDYENCDAAPCNEMMAQLQKFVDDPSNLGKKYTGNGKEYIVSKMDNFEYKDPIDGSLTQKQGNMCIIISKHLKDSF